MRTKAWSAVLLASLAAAPARGAWQDIPADEFTLEPPPAKGSTLYQNDYVALLQRQDSRVLGDCVQASRQQAADFLSLYWDAALLSENEILALAPFLGRLSRFAARTARTLQGEERYRRPRPGEAQPLVRACAGAAEKGSPYPSAHAAAAAVDACALNLIFPERSSRFIYWANYVGDLRVTVGLEHPSDVKAGRDLAALLCPRLFRESDFRIELLRAAAAARAAAGADPRPFIRWQR